MDLVTDRLFRHMAWANQCVFDLVSQRPDADLKLSAPNDDWSVGEILEHLTACRYADLLDELGMTDTQPPTKREEVIALGKLSATFDARLRKSAQNPIGFVEFDGEHRRIRRSRETILTQAIHHATEHRAQIAGIFACHQIRAIDLDELDLWAFANHEGLGD
jgi:uncharacterized damage-inducible protein DinB